MHIPKQLPENPAVRVPRARFRLAAGGRGHAEVWLTMVALLITLAATALFLRESFFSGERQFERSEPWALMRLIIFVIVVVLLVYGNVVYQLCRIGHLRRRFRHEQREAPRIADVVSGEPLVILVPSYREDLRTMRQTLLSAALQDYPNRRVVLLLDDPVAPQLPDEAASLAAARRLPHQLNALLRGPRRYIDAASAHFHARLDQPSFDLHGERRRLLTLYREIGAWCSRQAAAEPTDDHTDTLFGELTFLAHHDRIQQEIKRIRHDPDASLPDAAAVTSEYTWLGNLFQVEITSFERKRYVNLSHEPNKAANLNAYLGLIGTSARERWAGGNRHLDRVEPGDDKLAISFPDATYVITLDADSLLASDYARRLAAVMETPGNERLAVVQTPYTAIPGAPTQLERIAGATTDIQYLIHQGFTRFNATYWVGANALLRKAALDNISELDVERGYSITRFIQDRTVIEDTESTIDLVARGWRLFNYPERLAYSATPPDFGSLLIQRRRWANGGLLILPKLLRHAFRTAFARGKALELFVRTHYLISIAGTSVGLLALLFLPLGKGFDSPWLPLTAAPYFLLYTRDLRQMGYRRADVLRVYAFNLLLLPVNLAGVGKSIQQAVTGEKIPFGRTPKTEGRTAVPVWAIALEWLMLIACLNLAIWDALAGNWGHALFTLATAIALVYAVTVFVGVRASIADMGAAWKGAVRAFGSRWPIRRLDAERARE